MKITWIGHSCFKVEEAGYSIVFDPYDDGYVPGLGPVRETADEVLCSHEHGDHNARKRVTLVSGSKSPGDLGCKLPADQLAQLKDLDIAMIPVGGHYTIDAAQAADLVHKIAPAHVIPMHYRGDNNAFGFDVIGTVKEFTHLMDSVSFTGSCTVDLDNLPSEQVLVLTPQNA